MYITDTCYSCDFYDPDYGCTVHVDDKEYVCPQLRKNSDIDNYIRGY